MSNKKDEVLASLNKLTQQDIDYCNDLPTDLASNVDYQSAGTGALIEMLDYWNNSDPDLIIDEHTHMMTKGELPDKQTLALIGEVVLLELARYSIQDRIENRPKPPEPLTPLEVEENVRAKLADELYNERKERECND